MRKFGESLDETSPVSKYGHMEPNDTLTTKQVTEQYGLSRSTLRRRVEAGTLTPLLKLEGRTGAYVFTRAEIERYLEAVAA
jgi:predicted DNA-binding transcriptional regulator AlpA